jgi:glucokinase
MSETKLGIDIGGTKIACTAITFEADQTVTYQTPRKVSTPTTANAFIDSLAASLSLVKKDLGVKDWPAIGISTAGVVDSTQGHFLGATGNLKAIDRTPFPIAALLAERLDIPQALIHVENDANAACYGEVQVGAAVGYKNVVMITLGTGVGGGIVIDGHLIRGSKFSAAEVGHMRISLTNDRFCTCGRLGCWEAYASGTGLARTGRREIRELPHSVIAQDILQGKSVEELTTHDIIAAQVRGNTLAMQLMDKWHLHIATGLGNVMNVLDPDIVVIGGGMAQFVEMPKLRDFLNERIMDSMVTTPIVFAQLSNDAGMIGAAAMAQNNSPALRL